MAQKEGRPNKNFEDQLKRYDKALTPGTTESEIRKSYPGKKAAELTCEDVSCMVYSGDSPMPLESYFLCAECRRYVPDSIDSYVSIPTKTVLESKKRKAASAALYTAWRAMQQDGGYKRKRRCIAEK